MRLAIPTLQCITAVSKLTCYYEILKYINYLVVFDCSRCGITANR